MRQQQPRIVAPPRGDDLAVIPHLLLHPIDGPVRQQRLGRRASGQSRPVPRMAEGAIGAARTIDRLVTGPRLARRRAHRADRGQMLQKHPLRRQIELRLRRARIVGRKRLDQRRHIRRNRVPHPSAGRDLPRPLPDPSERWDLPQRSAIPNERRNLPQSPTTSDIKPQPAHAPSPAPEVREDAAGPSQEPLTPPPPFADRPPIRPALTCASHRAAWSSRSGCSGGEMVGPCWWISALCVATGAETSRSPAQAGGFRQLGFSVVGHRFTFDLWSGEPIQL